jgi:hypothetical protein
MGTKKPPQALLRLLPAVHAALERHGAGASGYSEERLRRDRLDHLIPLPGRGGVTDEEAEQAMFVAAMARSKTGHLCPGVRWYLLALSPEPKAADVLRGQLEQALDRVEKRGFRVPKLPTQGEKNASEHLDEYALQAVGAMRQFMLSLVSRLGERDENVKAILSELELLFPSVEPDPQRRSSAAALRDVGKILSGAFGRPMSQEETSRIFETQAKAGSMLLPLVDVVIAQQGNPGSAAHITDAAYVRELLRNARVDDLRAVTLTQISSASRLPTPTPGRCAPCSSRLIRSSGSLPRATAVGRWITSFSRSSDPLLAGRPRWALEQRPSTLFKTRSIRRRGSRA